MSFLRIVLGLKNKPTENKPAEVSAAASRHPTDPAGPISEALRPFLVFMEGMAGSLATERLEQLSLRETIKRFVELKPERSEPVKGALIVRSHREGKLVLWAFLAGDNSLLRGDDGKPLGCKAICGTLDEELTAMLGERELLIVE